MVFLVFDGKWDLKIHVFCYFCSDFPFFCGKLKKTMIFDGKITGEKRGFVGFWGLNGGFLFFAVKSGYFLWIGRHFGL